MPNNYVLLDRIELNATAASVTFDNIPQTGYTDLKIVMSVRSTDDYLNVSFNGLTTNLSSRTLGANSGGAFSISASNGLVYGLSESNSWTANTFNNAELYIPNYTSSNPKSWSVDAVTENNGTAITLALNAGLWNSTAAITSISFNQGANNLLAGSTFSLYGIAKVGTTPAIAPKANGGNVIGTDGTYWYHAFLSNGTFTPQVGLTADVLVVAGGGGVTAASGGGGGGAGGLLGFTSQMLISATGYTCTVGAGGSGGTNGGNSQFGALTVALGGGASTGAGANSGGSGGGGGNGAGGAGTSGQGNAGGFGYSTSSAGGGGATQVGSNGTSGASYSGAGKGGDGSSAYSSWGTATSSGENISGTYWFAGGGGGWGGSPAGGKGGGAQQGLNGVSNTGGGGGGYGSSGGSGIVIIRYSVAS